MTFINNSYFNNSYISNLDNDEKIVLFYLANNPLTNFTGICNINLKDISVSLKIENELISNIISKFQKDNILIFEDKFSTVIFLENEFWDFRRNLNQKTKTHLKKKIQSLPNEIKQMISDKNIDNLGQYVEYESAEVVVMELMQILHKIDENKLISDTLSTHLFNSVKNAIQRYENKRLNNINLINDTVYTNNININKKEKKVYTGKKINSNNTLSTQETISSKTEIYDPNKKRVGRPRKIKDGYLHITKVYVNDKGEKVVSGTGTVEKTDYNGKKLFGLRKKDYVSKVDKDKVNIDEVKTIFRENVAKYELTGRQLLISDKIANEYFDKRTSQQWRMSRTLKYDIMRWIVSNKVLKGIILEKKNQILKYKLSSEIDNKFHNHFNEIVEVNSGDFIKYNNCNGNTNESEQERENKRLAKDSIETMELLDTERKATFLNIIKIQRPEIYKLITN